MRIPLFVPPGPWKRNPDLPLMKKNRVPGLTAIFLALASLAVLFTGQGQSQVPAAINYQGRLTDTLGNPVSSGYYEIEFRIWDDASQNGAGNLVWGRSFALHVVTNGLFNILLNDDGGLITSPTTATNTLLTAFGGEDRYLGLTITQSNGVTVTEFEIRPRQRLVSAPYAIQSQTANLVAAAGVSTASLASGSVTAAKMAVSAVTTAALADNAVTAAKMASSAVTTAKIADGAVTASKFNVDGDLRLNDHTLFLRAGTDVHHGLRWTNSFGGESLDGPALFGNAKGVLGTTKGEEKVALSWDDAGAVSLFGSPVSLTSHLPSQGSNVTLTLKADGLLMFYAYGSTFYLQINQGGTTPVFTSTPVQTGVLLDTANDDSKGKFFTWPIRKGDSIRLQLDHVHDGSTANQLFFVPFGLGVGTSASDVIQ